MGGVLRAAAIAAGKQRERGVVFGLAAFVAAQPARPANIELTGPNVDDDGVHCDELHYENDDPHVGIGYPHLSICLRVPDVLVNESVDGAGRSLGVIDKVREKRAHPPKCFISKRLNVSRRIKRWPISSNWLHL